MAFIEDRKPFFADFGELAVVGGKTVTVIFDKAFLASLGIESSNPVLIVDSLDLSGVGHGTAVQVQYTNYLVVGVQPDGTGMTILELEKA